MFDFGFSKIWSDVMDSIDCLSVSNAMMRGGFAEAARTLHFRWNEYSPRERNGIAIFWSNRDV